MVGFSQSTLFLAVCTCLCGSAAPTGTAAPPGATSLPDSAIGSVTRFSAEAIASALVSAAGADYLAQRDAVLVLPLTEFEKLQTRLLGPEASPKENVIGWALERRRSHPRAAATFDVDSADAIANPGMMANDGRPQYRGHWPLTPEDDVFVFEWLLKRSDQPKDARWRFLLGVDRTQRASPKTPVAALALLDQPGAQFHILIHAALMQSDEDVDPRILEAAVDEYRRVRRLFIEPRTGTSAIVNVLSQRQSPDYRAAIEAFVAEERVLAQNAGVQPWDDAGAQNAWKNAVSAQIHAEREAKLKGIEPDPVLVAALQKQVDEARLRMNFRRHWETLERACARMRTGEG